MRQIFRDDIDSREGFKIMRVARVYIYKIFIEGKNPLHAKRSILYTIDNRIYKTRVSRSLFK